MEFLVSPSAAIYHRLRGFRFNGNYDAMIAKCYSREDHDGSVAENAMRHQVQEDLRQVELHRLGEEQNSIHV